MTLISKLKSMLGIDTQTSGGGATVAVEAQPRTETERAVKEPVTPSAADTGATSASQAVEPVERGGSADPVDSLSGVGPAYAGRLAEVGIETVADLASADPAEIAAETDLGEGRVSNWVEQANETQ